MKKNRSQPLVSIVVLNWNGLADTKVCLEHVSKLQYSNYELIVVDNGSRQDSKEYLSQQKNIIYIDNPLNRGFTGGHIDGLAKASGEYILLLNNDAVLAPDYIDKALPHFDDESVAVVGGKAYFWNEENPLLDTNNKFYGYLNVNPYSAEGIFTQSDFSAAQEVNGVSGSSVIVRKAAIDAVGYLHDPFFAYFEETDLFARMKRAGYRVIYSPDLHIWHRLSASTAPDSPFMYYHLFRNRFIFAVRNFESAFLWRFYAIYVKTTLNSLIRVILKPKSNPNMHRQYVRAAIYNLFHLPQTLELRRQLTKELGASRYNHQIYAEQQGVSFVVDCSRLNDEALRQFKEKLGQQDTNPLHEYVLVTRLANTPEFDLRYRNVRTLSDKRYFDCQPLTLGCLAARFDWMVLVQPEYIPSLADVTACVAATLSSRRHTAPRLVALRDSSEQVAPSVVMHKELFSTMGGLGSAHLSHTALFQYLVQYALHSGHLLWQSTDINDTVVTFTIPDLTVGDQTILNRAVRQDAALTRSQHVKWLDRLRNRYYRIYQFSTLFHWLFIPKIKLRLKAARLKNLVLYSITLRPKQLATELRHMRNEVLLHSGAAVDLSNRHKSIKRQITKLIEKPADIPVFIICRDRLEPLQQLVSWLEKHDMYNIVFIDNDSVYPPLVDYLAKSPYQVLRLFRNIGHTSPWKLGIIRSLVPQDFYIVTDPDVIPDKDCPDDVISYFLNLHRRHFAHQKVGFGLRIDDLPEHYPPKQLVIDWEKQFWNTQLSEGVYEAGVDTTFALYKPYTYFYIIHPSIRTGLPYAARHLPWYTDPTRVSVEDTFYHERADQNVNSWNAEALADRYIKELNKNS